MSDGADLSVASPSAAFAIAADRQHLRTQLDSQAARQSSAPSWLIEIEIPVSLTTSLRFASPYATSSISNNFSLPHTFRSSAAAASGGGGDLASVNGGHFADQFAAAAAYGSSMLYSGSGGGQYGPAHPYGAAASAARYQPPLQPPQPPATYTPLVNHTYALAASAAAAAATAASSASSPAQTAQVLLENDDASSQKSGRSSKSVKAAADQLIPVANIKEDPDAAAFR